MGGNIAKQLTATTGTGAPVGFTGKEGLFSKAEGLGPLDILAGGLTATQGLLDISAGFERNKVAKAQEAQLRFQAQQERIIGVSQEADALAAFNRFVGQRTAAVGASGITSAGTPRAAAISAAEDFQSDRATIIANANLRAGSLERRGTIEGLRSQGSGLQGFLKGGGRVLDLLDRINERRVK